MQLRDVCPGGHWRHPRQVQEGPRTCCLRVVTFCDPLESRRAPRGTHLEITTPNCTQKGDTDMDTGQWHVISFPVEKEDNRAMPCWTPSAYVMKSCASLFLWEDRATP